MSQKIQPVRGTKDLFLDEARAHQHIVDVARAAATHYAFTPFFTPIFEFTEVFKRTLGETSDVVNKEMYTFTDRNEESLTLRPEFTAGVARAFISNGLQQHLPLRLFSYGPLFRYERPQKGRQRHFHQVNFEVLGDASPTADVELIALAHHFLTRLGITQGLRLELNTLGDAESREAYRSALVAYFSEHAENLSEDSKTRLQQNPLRILDSKDPGDKALIENAPKGGDYLTPAAQEFFAAVQQGLTALNIPFNINPHIVRGLDYYTHTVFEFIVDSEELGAQNTVLAGGRYDGLIARMGGPETPAVGFAAGIERLALLCNTPPPAAHITAIIPISDILVPVAQQLGETLRHAGIPVQLFLEGKMAKKIKQADKKGITLAIMCGEDEWQAGNVALKNLMTGDQQEITRDKLAAFLHELNHDIAQA